MRPTSDDGKILEEENVTRSEDTGEHTEHSVRTLQALNEQSKLHEASPAHGESVKPEENVK